jgi:predicted acyl esterase
LYFAPLCLPLLHARQWIWGIKNASRKQQALKDGLEVVEKNFDGWMRRYPFQKGDSPLTLVPEYEDYLFDQVNQTDYNNYWKQIGLNTEEHIEKFADIPALFLSGWYDIYARSTIDFFVNLVDRKKTPTLLIMGPWEHVGPEGHVAGEVDFGVNALVSGNLAPNMFSLSRRWFDQFVEPATAPKPRKMTPEEKLAAAIKAAEEQERRARGNQHYSGLSNSEIPNSLIVPAHRAGPYTSLSRISHHSFNLSQQNLAESDGPSLYIPPSSIPRDRVDRPESLPTPTVRYFRMGGGDGHKTSQGCLFHGGVWMQSNSWPPQGTQNIKFFLGRRALDPKKYTNNSSSSNNASNNGHNSGESKVNSAPEGQPGEAGAKFIPGPVPTALLRDLESSSSYDYDPRDPCPTIGGNLFGYKNVLLAGAYDQVERSDMFLCSPPYLPLSSRRDVLVFRTPPLTERLDISGMPSVKLYISSDCIDTDFTAKLIDEYPSSTDFPNGFAMQITHGIRRCRYRNSREKAEFMVPNNIYEVTIELYPTSNLFNKGHRLRLDISSSNYPHFDINPNTGEEFESRNMKAAHNTVFYTKIFPSHILLPVQPSAQQHNSNANPQFNPLQINLSKM